MTRGCLQDSIDVKDKTLVKKFLFENKVEERLRRVGDYANNLKDEWRKDSLLNLVRVLNMHLNLRKNIVGLGARVSDEKAYLAAFGRSPDYIDSGEARETLRQRLASVGLELTNSNTLTELVDEWTKKGLVDAEQMYQRWDPMSRKMNKLTTEKIFPFLPDWVKDIPPESVDFDLIRKKVHYSGVNLAFHTIKDGKPIYKTIIKMSDTVTRASPDYELGLVAHEGMPGHGLHLPILHTLYSKGKYGFETTLLILCSPLATLAEGLATSTTNLLHGSKLEDKLTADELVAVAKGDLDVIGRNNVVIKYLKGEKDKDKLAQFLREQYCFSEIDSKKYTGWLFHPKMGKLLGVMYLPSYGVGRDVVKTAIEKYGRETVIPFVYGTRGQIDIINFPRILRHNLRPK